MLTLLRHEGYAAFADFLLKERETAMLPPFSYCAILSAEAKMATVARTWLTVLKHSMKKHRDISLLGPTTASMAKRRGFYREQLIIQAVNRRDLQKGLQELKKQIAKHPEKCIRHALDVDPIDLD